MPVDAICYASSTVVGALAITGAATRHEAIDDVAGAPDDATTCVRVPPEATGTDIYGFSHAIPEGSTIHSVSVFTRIYVDAGGSLAGQSPALRVGGTDYFNAGAGALGAWGNDTKTWATNPKTSAAWVYADLATIGGFGVQLSTLVDQEQSKCTQTYLVINYTAAAATFLPTVTMF